MKFHVISRRSFFVNQPIDSFQDSLFHGSADRGGEKPNRKNARLHCEPDRPLQLHKNAFALADVFAPEHEFVVSARVRDALADFPQLSFELVRFKTLFRLPFAAGDASHWNLLPTYYQQQDFLDAQVDDPDLHANVGDYFALVVPYFFQLKPRYPNLSSVSLQIGMGGKEILISSELLRDHPAFSRGYLVTSDEVFSRLKSFVDWTYFEHAEGRI